MANELELKKPPLASQVKYDNTNSGLDSNNVQGAIDEIVDPFARALFDTGCEPLFDEQDCIVTLLLECGSDT